MIEKMEEVEVKIDKSEKESEDAKENTKRWAKAHVEKPKQLGKVELNKPSSSEYSELFHAAVEQAGKDMDKSYEELQKQDEEEEFKKKREA